MTNPHWTLTDWLAAGFIVGAAVAMIAFFPAFRWCGGH